MTTRNRLDDKILCIGLAKTGTTSFHDAMEILGIRSVHHPRPKELADTTVEAYSDSPMTFLAPWFIHLYPTARFVLTTREDKAWAKSAMAWFGSRKIKTELAQFYRWANWQTTMPTDPEDFLHVKHTYEAMIMSMRPENFLVLPLEAEDKWERLCGFLGRPVPDVPYPHSNPGQ